MQTMREIKAAIIDPLSNSVVTAGEFQDLIERELIHLKHSGLKAGARVCLEAHSDIQFLSRLLAVIESGCIAIPFDPKSTAAEFQRLIASSQPDFRYSAETGCLEPLRHGERSGPALPSDARLFLLTSGTTGAPKAAIHGLSNLQARFENGRRAIDQASRRSCLSILPLHFGHGLIGVVLQALLDSDRLVLVPPELGDPGVASKIGKWIDEYEITFVSGTPATWTYITRMSAPPSNGSLRRVQMASAHATEELQRKVRDWAPGAAFYNCYGMTETATWVSDRLIEDGAVGGGACGLDPAVFADAAAHREKSRAGLAHGGADIVEVEVDRAVLADDVGDGLDGLAEHVIGGLEGLLDGGIGRADFDEPGVGDGDERIDLVAQACEAFIGLLHAARAFPLEGPGDDADGERAAVLRNFGNHRGGARAGAASHASGDEDHLGPTEDVVELVAALIGCALAAGRVAADAEALGQLFADAQPGGGFGGHERLGIGVAGHEGDAGDLGADHAVDGIAAAPSHAHNLDIGEKLGVVTDAHCGFLPFAE